MKYSGALLLIGLLLFSLSGCGQRRQFRSISGAAWGTTYHITYCSSVDLSAEICQVIDSIDSSLSPFNPSSTISRINNNSDLHADEMFAEVFALSQDVNRISGGAFDPTVAPLINIWGFGYKEEVAAPDSALIAEKLRSVGILDCSIDSNGYVSKLNDETEFNFSAIAKGYGVDKVADKLRQCGCSDFMVEIGGEISVSGKNPRGEDWKIQIDAPDLEFSGITEHNRLDVLSLTDCSIATSGNYRNFKQTQDGIFGHTISPLTGYPVMTNTLSATIIADRCALADALATATMAMPVKEAVEMIESSGVKAVLVVADGKGSWEIVNVGM